MLHAKNDNDDDDDKNNWYLLIPYCVIYQL